MQRFRCCVVMPTYNNAGTLKRVLEGILERTADIIVVNDGSTDDTHRILKEYPQTHVIDLPRNKGKGNALKKGFAEATAQGYEYVITIDSDGQHYPEDISIFLSELHKEENKNVLYIGSRNMAQSDVPGKSSFGNRFSNFWFWFETGIWLKDTQCGFRLYPLEPLKELKLYTSKFELEIEVIVRLAWRGTLVKNVPVQISYNERERVSHFRTVPDFTRISILNTCLVVITIFYIKPRDLIRKIKKKGFKKFFLENVLQSNDSPKKKALSIALGVFLGIVPFWGFQTLLVFTLAVFFRLNKSIAFAFSNVSIPPLIPIVVYLSVRMGMWITGEEMSFSIDKAVTNFPALQHLKVYVIGSFALAILMSLLFGITGYVILMFMKRKKMAINNG
ncbi:DUF2062 domain-containing protein [Pareuzebyella sediminis]|uniref:DUF2062 domain-containing protein n=1 Tax=Pareuzebyella sediminis TaxID=2607998 RepID=UPI0011ECE494|nr:DUF2062 domain-containing protein [Pareuzebyella sediminis]